MADENQPLSWEVAIQLLDANFHFRTSAGVGAEARSYRASPNGHALQIMRSGNRLEIELPLPVPALNIARHSTNEGVAKKYRYEVTTVGQLFSCIQALTKVIQKDLAAASFNTSVKTVATMGTKFPLNTILYGPPGTGKTYSVVLKSMSIVDGSDYGLQVSPDKYQELKKRYDKLVADGQISFVTFHQSYGYEDFIEGIRPRAEGQQISYEVKDGILKSIALRARENWDRATRESKLALDDNALFDRIWQQLHLNQEKSPDGKVKIKLFKDLEIEIELLQSGKNVAFRLSNHTSYSQNKEQLRTLWAGRHKIDRPSDTKSFSLAVLQYLTKLADELEPEPVSPEKLKPFVIIIDEINRGNISKIFGELITLVEEDKRLGEPFEMTVTLPYSQDEEEPFGLPPNLFLVGTMNTSDRSIALLDTALRRRFEFEELQPNPDVLKGIELDADVDLAAMLHDINERVEYLYDRDHTIGHAYFMDVKNLADLDRVFRRKVIPLLQEYFYEDWSKVVLVLNDHEGRFIAKTDDAPKGLQGADVGFDAKPRYKVRPEPFPVEAYRNLYT